MEKNKWVKVCPMCSSENFNVYKSDAYLNAVGSNNSLLCNNCGNIFSFPVEVSKKDSVKLASEIKTFPKATPPQKIVPFGFFLVRVLFKIFGTMYILIGFVGLFVNHVLDGLFLLFFGFALIWFSFKRDKELSGAK